ncbi:Imm32 family immunity protein [Hymenobacter lapidiphilus]|uniref:Uncharacterized protein n=1 Tax=Hymenobacter lapidiphilus TaxID=2608003 RepID=A0A7Y7PQY7_9BACT|nr:hypothetical protein [Hymenobacter lapidiphilus]NVO32358.1 hypothetical protein [Hymenobacter lapidiphilus]
MQITLEVPEYSPKTGILLHWVGDFEITVVLEAGAVSIRANQAGLVSLAGHLLNLAQEATTAGCHAHLDEHNSLQEGSLELILVRE